MKRPTTSHKLCFTRNAHAHLCLATVRRLFARAWYASAGEARVARVASAVRVEAVCCTWVVWCRSCLVFVPVVSKPQWPRRAVVLDLHLHRQRTLSSVIDYIYVSRAYLNVLDWGNDIPRYIPERDPTRTYVLCENRSSIQSLTLMRSAIDISSPLRRLIKATVPTEQYLPFRK